MKAAILLASLLSPLAVAGQCDMNTGFTQADYTVTTDIVANKQHTENTFTLWRTPHQVAKQNPQFIELWQQLRNQQIRPIRYFQHAQRGIEYQPSEVQGEQDWSSKYQLVSDKFLASMTHQKSTGEGCELTEYYTQQQGDSKIELSWLANQKLLKAIRISTPTYSREITLTSSHHNQQNVQAEFAKWDNYQTTDYADIGDNESDPFLAKMINLGFVEHGASGFYDAQGNQLKGEHGHHH